MSRSYKKTPLVKDHNKGMKTVANRKVRRCKDVISNGRAYKKLMCSYDICDWSFSESYAEYTCRQERYKREYALGIRHYPVYECEKYQYSEWYKMYKMK